MLQLSSCSGYLFQNWETAQDVIIIQTPWVRIWISDLETRWSSHSYLGSWFEVAMLQIKIYLSLNRLMNLCAGSWIIIFISYIESRSKATGKHLNSWIPVWVTICQMFKIFPSKYIGWCFFIRPWIIRIFVSGLHSRSRSWSLWRTTFQIFKIYSSKLIGWCISTRY